MAGLHGALFPAEESLKEPLVTDQDRNGIELEEGKAEYCQNGHDVLNSANFGGKDTVKSQPSENITDSTQTDASLYSLSSHSGRKSTWKDAALYVHEGEKDAKIFHHPQGRWSRRAFKTLHHPAYCVFHLIASVVLMLLAFVETPLTLSFVGTPLAFEGKHPTHQTDKNLLSFHSVFEIILLSFFVIHTFLKFVWFGPRRFFTHIRTMFISIVLLVMIIGALTVLIRQNSHPRFMRALRPILLIDNHYLQGVRRVMRQIFLCIKPITDVLLLTLFFIVFFSLLGYYIFAEVDPSFFSSFWQSFVSLFITMTTSNNPDVMLEAYYEYAYSPPFFIIYLAITFYFLMNVLLAVVYGSFEEEEKKKFKKLFQHKLLALDKAYEILATDADDGNSTGICFYDFLMFMHYYQPLTPEWQVMCIFKALHHDCHQQHKHLSKEEFRSLYEVRNLRWKPDKSFNSAAPTVRLKYVIKIHEFCYLVVKSKAFNIIMNLIVLSNLFFLIMYTIVTSGDSHDRYIVLHDVLPVSCIFISIYIVEIALRIIGVGPYNYFRKKRNICDFIIILISFICLLFETRTRWLFLASVRPFKLLRVLRLKRRYRDIGSATIVLLPRLASMVVLLFVVYYFYAIVGIEALGGAVFKGCCDNNDTWFGVGSSFSGIYYRNSTDNIPPQSDVYYILNFDDIVRSYVTLFVLMVVNNWYIIMEGFASEFPATSWLVRLYFISFFIVMLVILQVVISFIVDEFKFKVLNTAKERICPVHEKPFEHCHCKRYRKKVVEVTLLPADIKVLDDVKPTNHKRGLSYLVRKFQQIKLFQDMQVNVLGRRRKTKDDIKLKIFEVEIKEWTSEYEARMKAKKTDETGTPTKDRLAERAKKSLRECFLYFIDWVIE